MMENKGHIISTFSWDTLFDRKDRATELQNRLSRWSRMHMPREIAGVFDDICPPEQVWRIQSLQIDLGKIDYSDLEFELSEKLRKQLYERLTDLILYNTGGDDAIEILDGNTSGIEMIRHFLLLGYFPWSDNSADQDINVLLAHQLDTNRHQLIIMLKEIGMTHLNVRRRIAWQVREPNIVEIIKGLEPGNYAQVLDFSNEMVKLQHREVIVQDSLADFKKNLWFWILNYLLSERGTLFNKIALAKSNIRQMADHYHVSYADIIAMIERAVEKVEQREIVNAEMIVSLKFLIAESHKDIRVEKLQETKKTDFWALLQNQAENIVRYWTETSITEFNDLVISLAAENEAKFRETIIPAMRDEKILNHLIAKLNDATIETLVASLAENQSIIITENILFIDRVLKAIHIAISRRWLWETGIRFLMSRPGKDFRNEAVINHLITEISAKKQINKIILMEQLLSANNSSRAKKAIELDVYSSLSSVFVSEITGAGETFTTERFSEVISRLADYLKTGGDKSEFISFKKIAASYIKHNLRMAFKVIVNHPRKNDVKELLPYILDHQLIELLVKNAGQEIAGSVTSIRDAARSIGKDNGLIAIASWIDTHIAEIALNLAIRNNIQNHFAADLLSKMADEVPGSLWPQFELLLIKLTVSHVNNVPYTKTVIDELINRKKSFQKLPVTDQAVLLVRNHAERTDVGKLLFAEFSDKAFAELRGNDGPQGAILLNYLAADGKRLMDTQLNAYVEMLTRILPNVSKSRIRTVLKELYWQCVVNYAAHKGQVPLLKQSFEKAVWHRFSRQISKTLGDASILLKPENKLYSLPGGEQLELNEIFSLIEVCLAEGSKTTSKEGKIFRFEDLFVAAAEIDGGMVRKMIRNTALTERSLQLLYSELSFSGFTLLIANDAPGNIYESISTLRLLQELIADLAPGIMTRDLLVQYWKQLWKIIETGNLATDDLQGLLQQSFYRLAKEGNADSEVIIIGIRNRHYLLTPSLRQALADYAPAFLSLPMATKTLVSRKLEQMKQRGMLYNLAYHLVTLRQIPLWFGASKGQSIDSLLNEIATHYPINIFLVLKDQTITERQMLWVSQTVDFKTLTQSVGMLNPAQQSVLNNLVTLYELFGRVVINGASTVEMQYLVFKKLIKAWTNNNWRIVSSENIWNEIAWSAYADYHISRKQLVQDIRKARPYLPPALQVTFGYLKEQDIKKTNLLRNKEMTEPIKKLLQKSAPAINAKDGIPVKNAGLVLVNNYIPMLLERLGLVQDKEFTGIAAREQAVHYLQYVVTGLSRTEEHLLPLNKVLCGLSLDHPVPDGIEISEVNKKMIDGLIEAMIGHWSSIGDSSVNGFRGNWLVRDGLLTERDDRWELKVEKKVYDILLNQSPFSFSIIKYPWTDKPIHVDWPY